MLTEQTTLTQFLIEERRRHPDASGELNALILDVALACGFVSASHFSKCYRESFGKKPREERMTSVPLRPRSCIRKLGSQKVSPRTTARRAYWIAPITHITR